jgi:DNA-binding beta-propeller fold protein YncE
VLVVPATSRWKGDSTGLTFLVLNNTSRRICRYSVNDERLTTVILRHNPFSVAACFDPNDSNRVFVSDNQRVYSANEYGHLTTIAGGDVFGMADGIGSVARFQCVAGMVCTGDGSTLYVSDYGNGRVRKIDLSTRAVSTVLKMERDDDTCRSICWDTIDGVKPYSGLYIASENAITRLDIVSGKLTVWDSTFTALHMICTIGGYLVVSIVECNAIYSIDTQTFDIPACIVAGNPYQTGSCDGEVRTEAEFHDPSGFALVADEQALVVADSRNHCLRSVPLPTRLFEKRHRLEVGAVAASPAV